MSKLTRVIAAHLRACLFLSLCACAPTRSLPSVLPSGPLGEPPPAALEPEPELLGEVDGSLLAYQAHAIAKSPRVRAAF